MANRAGGSVCVCQPFTTQHEVLFLSLSLSALSALSFRKYSPPFSVYTHTCQFYIHLQSSFLLTVVSLTFSLSLFLSLSLSLVQLST